MYIYLFEFCSFCILFIFRLVKSFFVQNTRKKCKFLKSIPYDVNGNCCEIIASMCFRMLFSVPMINVATGGDEQVLRTTKGVQTIDIDVSDEEGSRGS
jgi:hypothetical protein